MKKKVMSLVFVLSVLISFTACKDAANNEEIIENAEITSAIDESQTAKSTELAEDNTEAEKEVESEETTEIEKKEETEKNSGNDDTSSNASVQSADISASQNQDVQEEVVQENSNQEEVCGWAGPGWQSGYLNPSQSTSVLVHDDSIGGDVVFNAPQQVVDEFAGHEITWIYWGEGSGMVCWGRSDWASGENAINYYSGPSGNLIKKSIFVKDASGMGGKQTEIYY